MQKRPTWTAQIVTIENKGYQAFLDGLPESANPYTKGYRNSNGNGGGLQRQRRQAWSRGYDISKNEKKTASAIQETKQ